MDNTVQNLGATDNVVRIQYRLQRARGSGTELGVAISIGYGKLAQKRGLVDDESELDGLGRDKAS